MNIIVPKDHESIRLDKYLVKQFPEHSRTYWQNQIKEGRILINKEKPNKHALISPEDAIQITEPQPIAEQKMEIPNIEIIAETDDYIVINKPDGLVVHPTAHGKKRISVAHWAVNHDKKIARVGDDPSLRPGIIHRLDRDVSGVMIIGKTQEFFMHLKTQFQARSVHKQYTALVHGRDLEQEFDVTFKLDRKKGKGKMAAIPTSRDDGKAAHTHFIVQERFTSSTLLHAHPTSGRMHQIRAHLYAFGHPIIGDTLYTSNKYISRLDDQLGRIFLHASKITFTDLSGNEVTYESELTPKLKTFLLKLKPIN